MYNAHDQNLKEENIVHKFNEDSQDLAIGDNMSMKKMILVFVLFIVFGIISGYFGAQLTKKPVKNSANSVNTNMGDVTSDTAPAKKAGVNDTKTFKDSAEGILKEGGIGGEGDYHLERPGGESQNVYLTSTTVDLSEYVDKKVKVQGETYSAEKAGWLMDVGLIELSQ